MATFTQRKGDTYYFSGYQLNDGGQPSSLSLYDMDHGNDQVLLFDHPDLAFFEYEIYSYEKLRKAERIDAEQLMGIEMPQSNSVRAKFTYYDPEGNRY